MVPIILVIRGFWVPVTAIFFACCAAVAVVWGCRRECRCTGKLNFGHGF